MRLYLAAAALAVASIAAPAGAQDRVVAVTVAHNDLNLTDASDVARFDRRIARAAREVCGIPSTADLTGRRKQGACARDFVTRAAPARAAAMGMTRGTMVAGR